MGQPAPAATALEELRDERKDDKKLVDHIKTLYQAERKRKRPFAAQWYYNVAFATGHQWTNITPLGELIKVEDIPEHRVYRVENEILPRVMRNVSKATQDPPAMECVAATEDDADQHAADVGTQFLEYHQNLQDFNRLDVKALVWAACGSKGFYKVLWNPAAGKIVSQPRLEIERNPISDDLGLPEINTDGTPRESVEEVPVRDTDGEVIIDTFAIGEIDVEVCSPFEIFPVGHGDSLEDKNCSGVLHVVKRTVNHIKQVYDVDVREDVEVRDYGDVYRDMVEQLGTLVGGNRTKDEVKQEQEPSALVYEYWEKPTIKFPLGRLVVVAGETLVKDGPIPYEHRRLPFIEIYDLALPPGRYWPTTRVEQAIPLQKELNVLVSKIEEHLRVFVFPKLLRFQGDGIEEPWTNEAGQEIMVNSRQVMPESWSPDQLGADVYNRITMLRQRLDDLFSTHEVSRAQAPSGVKSGVAIAFLLEQDDTQLGPMYRTYHAAREKVGFQILSLAKQFYDEPRKMRIMGSDGRWKITSFQGSDLEGVADVRVRHRSSMPMSRAGAIQQVHDIAQTFPQFFNDPTTGQLDYERLSQDLGVASVRKMYERVQVDMDQAKREHDKLRKGEPTNVMFDPATSPDPQGANLPNFFDNHGAHFKEHSRFMKSAEFDELDSEAKQRFYMHLQATGKLLAGVQRSQQQPAAQAAPPREVQQQSLQQQQEAAV